MLLAVDKTVGGTGLHWHVVCSFSTLTMMPRAGAILAATEVYSEEGHASSLQWYYGNFRTHLRSAFPRAGGREDSPVSCVGALFALLWPSQEGLAFS